MLAAHVRQGRIRPDVVLCSPARRARETFDAVAGSLGGSERMLIEEELYGAGAATLLARLRRLDASVISVMLIGHNPGLRDLVVELAGDGDDEAVVAVRRKLPTAGLAILSLPPGQWAAVAPGTAYLDRLVVPRRLR